MYDNVPPATDTWELLQIRSNQACTVPKASKASFRTYKCVCSIGLLYLGGYNSLLSDGKTAHYQSHMLAQVYTARCTRPPVKI